MTNAPIGARSASCWSTTSPISTWRARRCCATPVMRCTPRTTGSRPLQLMTSLTGRRRADRHPAPEARWLVAVPAGAATVADHDRDPGDRVRRGSRRHRGRPGRRPRLPQEAACQRGHRAAHRADRGPGVDAAPAVQGARGARAPGCVRADRRSLGRHVSDDGPPQHDRGERRVRPAARRDRHRQGAGRPRAPRPQPAPRQALRRGELRLLPRHVAGSRAVRPRTRRLHRGGRAARRALRRRARRHPAAGRGGRHVDRAAGQAAARPRGARHRAARHERLDRGRRSGDRGDAPQPRGRWSRPACSGRISTIA